MTRLPHGWIAALVALAAALPYLSTFQHDFVWDDAALVEQVTQAHAQGGLAGVVSAEFRMDPREPTGYYRPVVLLSLWADRALGGGAPAAFHKTNVLLHVVCSLLVAALAGQLLNSRAAALLAGLLFALHPVHVESVAWVSGRTDLWAAVFVLGATLAWAVGRNAGRPRRGLLMAASGAAFCLALLSKEVAVVLPGVLAAMEWWVPATREGGAAATTASRPWTGWARRIAPWAAAWLAGAAIAVAARLASGLGPVAGRITTPLATLSADPALLPQFLTKALALLAVPWPLSAFWARHHLAWQPATLAFAALGIAVFVLAARRGERRTARAGAFWALAFLLPAAGFAPAGAAPFAERFLYIPSIGFCLAVAALVPFLSGYPRLVHPAAAGAVALLAVLGVSSGVRAATWRDEMSLFQSIVRADPSNASMWDNLGQAYLAAQRPPDAERAFREALRLDPRRANAWNGLGALWGRAGRLDEARTALETAIRLDPSAPHARFNLAMLCLSLDDLACAERERRALQTLAPEAAARVAGAMAVPR